MFFFMFQVNLCNILTAESLVSTEICGFNECNNYFMPGSSREKKKKNLTFLLGLSYQLSYQFRRSPTFAVRERRQNDSLTESELPFLSPSSLLPPHYSPHALLALLKCFFPFESREQMIDSSKLLGYSASVLCS